MNEASGNARMYSEAMQGAKGSSERSRVDPEHNSREFLMSSDQRRSSVQTQLPGSSEEKLILECFEEQVAANPDEIAVAFEKQYLTYAELNSRANKLARFLRAHGVGPDSLVALFMERSSEMVVGLLGVLKAGAAYVPMDPSYPADRLARMLRDAEPSILLTQERMKTCLPPVAALVIALDSGWSEIACQEAHNLELSEVGLNHRHLMYVIYTSGSTGEPKGVMNEHCGLANRLRWMQQRYLLDARDRVLQKTSYSFDVSVWEVFWPLLNGARLVLARPLGERDPEYLREIIEREGVTIVHFVPSMLQRFLDRHRIGRCGTLRNIICSGEELSASLQNKCLTMLPGARLSNLYGPTEAAIDVTAWECAPQEVSSRVPIGVPISNTELYILDERCEPVPIGVVGEIYIGGIAVARGYLNRPELTASKFICDPFSAKPNGRLYKSGDLGRWRPDGNIEYLGRNDQQVKIRGYRIELGDIEAQLLQHPDVKNAAVIAQESSTAERRLVAYVVLDVDRLKTLSPESSGNAGAEIQKQWKDVYEERYSSGPSGPSFVGWNSSYTGQPIPQEMMREWLKNTVERIRSLKPLRVLEIGCGTGLLVEQLAPACEMYSATDISDEAIVRLGSWCRQRDDLKHVSLQRCSALDLQVQRGAYDTVILNSVVQHFPDLSYLKTVLERAVSWLPPRGRIFIGDVRPLSLLKMFHTSVQLAKSAAPVAIGDLIGRVKRALERERDLLIDPSFFECLPQQLSGIGEVRVMLKRGQSQDEMTRYRYDVVLEVGEYRETVLEEHVAWRAGRDSIGEYASRTKDRRPASIRLLDIPNQRVSRDLAETKLVAELGESCTVEHLRSILNEQIMEGESPEEFIRVGEMHGYDVRTSWVSGCEEGLFYVDWIDPAQKDRTLPAPGAPRSEPHSITQDVPSFSNDPWGNSLKQRWIPELRQFLKDKLPLYMVPAAVVILEDLPVTASGKIDRRSLPTPEDRSQVAHAYVPPDTPTETQLCEIWQQVLNLNRVGVEDNFFELGGHSLLGMQLAVMVADKFSTPIPVLAVFDYPDIRTMARFVERESGLPPAASALCLGLTAM